MSVVYLNTTENSVTTLNIPEVHNLKVASYEHVPADTSTYMCTRSNMLWTCIYHKQCVNTQ